MNLENGEVAWIQFKGKAKRAWAEVKKTVDALRRRRSRRAAGAQLADPRS